MKKLFISISVAFVFLLSCIIPFTVSALDYTSSGYIDTFFQYNENYIRNDSENYYLYFEIRDSDGDRYYKHIVFIPKDRLVIEHDNSNIILSDSANLGFGSVYTDGNQNQSNVWGSATNFTSITFNLDLHKLIRTENSSGGIWYETRTIREFETTIPDFEDSCPLVFTFAPELSGNVDRSYTVGGVTYYSDTLIMGVTNNSGYNWAYDFTIYDSSGNIVYQFLKYEWENTFDIAAEKFGVNDVVSQHDTKVQLIGSDWHLVQGGSSVVQRFKWTQLPLKTGENYTLECYAYKCGTGEYLNNVMLSDFVQNRTEFIDNPIDDYFNENAVLAYSSTFKMLNYDDIVYDHNDTSNGIIPYSSSEDYYKARTSRLATDDGNGNIDYKNYSAYDDPNSWYNKESVSSSLDAMKRITEDSKNGKRNFYYEYSSGSVDGVSGGGNNNFSSLVADSSGFLTLCKNVFRYFPDWLTTLFFGGMLCIVLVAIWRKI